MTRESAKRLALSKLRRLGEWNAWAFPIVHNQPNTDLLDMIVGVQPMNEPAGTIFYMEIVDGNSWRYRLERWLRRWWYRLKYGLRRWEKRRVIQRLTNGPL